MAQTVHAGNPGDDVHILNFLDCIWGEKDATTGVVCMAVAFL